MILKRSGESGTVKTAAIEERIGSLFQPDTLLGEDYAANFRRKLPLEPGRELAVVQVIALEHAFDQRSLVLADARRPKRHFPNHVALAARRVAFPRRRLREALHVPAVCPGVRQPSSSGKHQITPVAGVDYC